MGGTLCVQACTIMEQGAFEKHGKRWKICIHYIALLDG